MLRPCNLARRGGEGGSVAWASGGISETMGRTLECVWIPDQQARIVVALGRLLRVFVDDLSRDTLEGAGPGLGRVALDARLGLSVDEGGDWGELGVVGVVDGLDGVLEPELIGGERRASGGREPDAFRAGWLGEIHERTRTSRETNHGPCLELALPLPGLFQPWVQTKSSAD